MPAYGCRATIRPCHPTRDCPGIGWVHPCHDRISRYAELPVQYAAKRRDCRREKAGIQQVIFVDPTNGSDPRAGAINPYELPSRRDYRPMSEYAAGRDGERTAPDGRVRAYRLGDWVGLPTDALFKLTRRAIRAPCFNQQQVSRRRIRGSSFCGHQPPSRSAVPRRRVDA